MPDPAEPTPAGAPIVPGPAESTPAGADAGGAATEPTGSAAEESGGRISAWWILVLALILGAALTALADLVSGGESLSAVGWLGTTVGVAALVIAVGIYRLQERSGHEAHAELMEQLEAQGELLSEFAERATSKEEGQAQVDSLTGAQRAEIEARFGAGSIAGAIDPGRGRGGGPSRARLVRLNDGRLLSVYDRDGRFNVREIPAGRGPGGSRSDLRPPRGRR